MHWLYVTENNVLTSKQRSDNVVTFTSSPLESTSHILLSASSLVAPCSCMAKDNRVAIPKLAYKTNHQSVTIAYEQMFVIW